MARYTGPVCRLCRRERTKLFLKGCLLYTSHATIAGLKSLKRPEDVARLRGKPADEVIPRGVLRAYRERQRASDLFQGVEA